MRARPRNGAREARVSSRRRRKETPEGWRPAAERDETVDLVPNPLLPAQLRAVKWRKSRHSNPSGNCVEMARLPGEQVAVRDSHRPEGPALLFTRAAWERFLRGVREGAAELALAGREPTRGDRPARNITAGELQWFAGALAVRCSLNPVMALARGSWETSVVGRWREGT